MIEFKSKFVQEVYLRSPLPKESISLEILEEIAEAFCIRNECSLENVYKDGEISFVIVSGLVESLEVYEEFRFSFEDMGYSGVLLETNEL